MESRVMTDQEWNAVLQGNLSQDQLSQLLADNALSAMDKEAIEGLQFLSPDERREAVNQVQLNLSRQIKKRKKRNVFDAGFSYWNWMIVLTLLALIALAYLGYFMITKQL